jgi:hypothetical protein
MYLKNDKGHKYVWGAYGDPYKGDYSGAHRGVVIGDPATEVLEYPVEEWSDSVNEAYRERYES